MCLNVQFVAPETEPAWTVTHNSLRVPRVRAHSRLSSLVLNRHALGHTYPDGYSLLGSTSTHFQIRASPPRLTRLLRTLSLFNLTSRQPRTVLETPATWSFLLSLCGLPGSSSSATPTFLRGCMHPFLVTKTSRTRLGHIFHSPTLPQRLQCISDTSPHISKHYEPLQDKATGASRRNILAHGRRRKRQFRYIFDSNRRAVRRRYSPVVRPITAIQFVSALPAVITVKRRLAPRRFTRQQHHSRFHQQSRRREGHYEVAFRTIRAWGSTTVAKAAATGRRHHSPFTRA